MNLSLAETGTRVDIGVPQVLQSFWATWDSEEGAGKQPGGGGLCRLGGDSSRAGASSRHYSAHPATLKLVTQTAPWRPLCHLHHHASISSHLYIVLFRDCLNIIYLANFPTA